MRLLQPAMLHCESMVNIPANDVRETVAFFRDLVGLEEGVWAYPDEVGDFDRASDALANFGTDNRGIHVVKPDPAFAAKNGFKHNPTIGGHKAFTVKDIGAVIDRLNKAGIDHTDADPNQPVSLLVGVGGGIEGQQCESDRYDRDAI